MYGNILYFVGTLAFGDGLQAEVAHIDLNFHDPKRTFLTKSSRNESVLSPFPTKTKKTAPCTASNFIPIYVASFCWYLTIEVESQQWRRPKSTCCSYWPVSDVAATNMFSLSSCAAEKANANSAVGTTPQSIVLLAPRFYGSIFAPNRETSGFS
jgi:hypothetical protein